MKLHSFLRNVVLLVAAIGCVTCSKAEIPTPDGSLGNPSTSIAISTDPVRVLAIGNSFSANAIEQNLNELALADGRQCEVGNLMIGGCSLERHVQNIRSDAKEYSYLRRDVTGKTTSRANVSISEALGELDWDVISVQQVSQLAGVYTSYDPWLPELLAYVKERCPQAKIVFHQTWAYTPDSNHAGFANYNRDQQTMYEAVVNTVRWAAERYGIDYVVPAGTAIQNLRGVLGEVLNTDGFHLNPLGCYAVACTWYETIFGADVTDNSYVRSDLDPEQQRQARRAAHAAVTNPWSVTDLR